MSVNVGVFIDVSNLFYSARSMGVEVNYIRLLEHVTRNRHLIRASAYTGIDPENGSQRRFVDFLSANGYRVVCKDIQKHESGRIKADLDVEITLDVYMMSENFDVVVLVTGDGDFKRLVEVVQQKGVRVEIVGFGASTSSELIALPISSPRSARSARFSAIAARRNRSNGEVPAAARDVLNGAPTRINRPRPA